MGRSTIKNIKIVNQMQANFWSLVSCFSILFWLCSFLVFMKNKSYETMKKITTPLINRNIAVATILIYIGISLRLNLVFDEFLNSIKTVSIIASTARIVIVKKVIIWVLNCFKFLFNSSGDFDSSQILTFLSEMKKYICFM